MIKGYFLNSKKLPIVFEAPKLDPSFKRLDKLVAEHKDFFRFALLEYGAILFRGFQVKEQNEFRDFVQKFSEKEFFNYAGGASPRTTLEKNVYTSTEYPPNLTLDLHNELSYSKNFPRHLYFFCEIAPEEGGETTLGDSRRILRRISPKIVELFKQKGVLYERNLRAEKGFGYSWREAFETEKREEVEKICRETDVDFEWLENGFLRLRQISPATLTHPETSQEVWFNQAHGFHESALDEAARDYFRAANEKPRLNSYFGDGSTISTPMLDHIRKALLEETIPHRWQTSDILILDNILTAHGRMPFSGKRKIVLAMT